MNRQALACLVSMLALAASHEAFAWRGSATYHGRSGATTYSGSRGGAAVQGPNGHWAAEGPNGGTAHGNGQGTWSGTGARGGTASGSNGSWTATGQYGNTASGTRYNTTTVYHGGAGYYPYGAVAAGVAVGTAAAVATYPPAPYYYAPPPVPVAPPPAAVVAAHPAADRCAAALPPRAQAIYEKSLPGVLAGASVTDAVTATARAMVMAGALPRADAQTEGRAAGACLMQLK